MKQRIPAGQGNNIFAFLAWVLGGVRIQVEKAGGGVVGCRSHEIVHWPQLQNSVCGLGNEREVRRERVQSEGRDDRI